MIIGGDASSKRAVVEALNEWTSNVNGLQFTEVSDKNSADITLNFQNGGSGGGGDQEANGLGSVSGSGCTDIVGETLLHGSNGLINSAQITIATARFWVFLWDISGKTNSNARDWSCSWNWSC